MKTDEILTQTQLAKIKKLRAGLTREKMVDSYDRIIHALAMKLSDDAIDVLLNHVDSKVADRDEIEFQLKMMEKALKPLVDVNMMDGDNRTKMLAANAKDIKVNDPAYTWGRTYSFAFVIMYKNAKWQIEYNEPGSGANGMNSKFMAKRFNSSTEVLEHAKSLIKQFEELRAKMKKAFK